MMGSVLLPLNSGPLRGQGRVGEVSVRLMLFCDNALFNVPTFSIQRVTLSHKASQR